MFYPPEILSRRHKGHLPICWFAATLGEKQFFSMFKKTVVINCNVNTVCDTILEVSQSESKKRSQRFSLYLSSQLMYGITKIHSHQTKIFLLEIGNVHKMFKKLNFYLSTAGKASKPGHDFDAYTTVADVSTLSELLVIPPGRARDCTITDVEFSSEVWQGDDLLHFGALTSSQMDFLLEGELGFLDTTQMRHIPGAEVDSTAQIEVPLPEVESIDKRLTEGERTALMQSEIPADRSTFIEPPPPQTPTKRRPEGTVEEAVTPSKVRRTITEPELGGTVPEAQDTSSSVIAQGTTEPECLPLAELEVSTHKIDKKRKRKVFMDTKLQLNSEDLRFWTERTQAYTVPLVIAKLPYKLKANELLAMPSTSSRIVRRRKWLRERNWAAELIANFQMNIVESTARKDSFAKQALEKIRRRETINKSSEGSAELSTGKPLSKSKDDSSETSKPGTNLMTSVSGPRPVPQLPLHDTETDVPIETTMQIAEVDLSERVIENGEQEQSEKSAPLKTGSTTKTKDSNSSNDIDDFLPRSMKTSYGRKFAKASKAGERLPEKTFDISQSSSQSYARSLIKPELLANLEVLWHDQPVVRFGQICPPESCNKFEASCCFQMLLELHAERKVILRQRSGFRNIWIQKYDLSSDSNDGI